MLRLARDLYVLWERDPSTGGELTLPEGTPIRDPVRTGESELLGAEWQFKASLDGGRTWRRFATMPSLEDRFPAG